MPKSATACLPEMAEVLDSPFVRDGLTSNPHELQFGVHLAESDVEALKAGIVTPWLQQYAVRLLAMRDGR